MDEAKKQNWDPSVQGLVAFPEVLSRLSQDIAWTTALGNAFLAQQAEVMQAVQRMRAQAEARGTLRSTPQETVTTQNQGGQTAISIEPANPDVWYVPNYNPAYVWGSPADGYYPPLLYAGIDVGFGWDPGIDLGLYFGGWVVGAGAAGDGPELVWREYLHQPFFLPSLRVRAFPWRRTWAIQCGIIIRNTDSAFPMPIARWPEGLEPLVMAVSAATRLADSAARGAKALVAARWRRNSVSEIRVLSRAAGRAITVPSAVITTAV